MSYLEALCRGVDVAKVCDNRVNGTAALILDFSRLYPTSVTLDGLDLGRAWTLS